MAKTDNYGLNKLARNAETQKQLVKSQTPPPLDPPFPYDAIRFRASLFGVTEWSRPDADWLSAEEQIEF